MNTEKIGRAIITGAGDNRHMNELGRLASTLGVEVVSVVEQNRRDGAGYLGRGKREELGDLVKELDADFVIADDELTASQSRVLEKATKTNVVDRTELIIRIFEAHAEDSASKLEVELADLAYRLPRVKGRNEALSRLGGGVGTRGPGEQQLEYDRRVIRERMRVIGNKLKEERSSRSVRGMKLKEHGPPTVALVGYTNAGKTTILNALSGAERSTRDWLFETLETTTRLVEGRANGNVFRPDIVVTDTVGFIRKLPKQLVHSFESTVEAAKSAEVLVLCADASSSELKDEIQTSMEIVASNSVQDQGEGSNSRVILCLNKVDLISESSYSELRNSYPEAVMISAINGGGDALLEQIYSVIASNRERMEVMIPHSEYASASRLYSIAEIHHSESTNQGVKLDITVPKRVANRYASYRVS
jgi:GTP-binding protein HflX